jgi:hypothetical protein
MRIARNETVGEEGGGMSPECREAPHLHREALSKALREMGFRGKHATHGFRGIFRTVGRERLGMDIDVLKAQLPHAKRGDVQKAYDRTLGEKSGVLLSFRPHGASRQ